MADDIQDLGTAPIVLRLPINYANEISGRMNYFRDILQFAGTTQEIIPYATIQPRTYGVEFKFLEKQDEYNFLEFWHQVRGQNLKFWFILEELAFDLITNIHVTDTAIGVQRNGYLDIWQGYERYCVRKRNGEIITRKIVQITEDAPNDMYLLDSGHFFTEELPVANIYGVYFIVPARFDGELLKIDHESSVCSDCNVNIQELLKEYPS